MYENGIGAINLPYDGTQLGTYNGRATHPKALLKMEGFIEILTGGAFSISNPFLFATKGEMCRNDAVQELAEFIALTFSCDGFPVRAKNRAQCGCCTSWVLRRLALESAGLARYDQSGYLNDLSSSAYVGTEKQPDALRAMNWQAHRIRIALAEPDAWQALVYDFKSSCKNSNSICAETATSSQPSFGTRFCISILSIGLSGRRSQPVVTAICGRGLRNPQSFCWTETRRTWKSTFWSESIPECSVRGCKTHDGRAV